MFPDIRLGLLERYQVRSANGPVRLADIAPDDRQGLPLDRPDVEAATEADVAEIDHLQDILYAEARRTVLVILQGMDASGKDGAVRKVFGPIDPLGVTAVSFKKPTRQELSHDYLWRIHTAVPPAGIIGVFNRSHYEDVVVPRVHNLLPLDRIEARYEQINAFERILVENDVVLLKFVLHISKKEQKKRLQARLDDPNKRWKFDRSDIEERQHWDDYMVAYDTAFARCSTLWAPWFVVPAERKWYRNAVITRILRSTLEAMDLRYPPEMADLNQLRIE